MAVPLPPMNFTASTPSYASDAGSVGEIGAFRVGDYYAKGAEVSGGWGWQELAVVGAVVLIGYRLYKR